MGALGRVTKKDYSDAATPDVTYAFDPWFPRQTSRVDGAGTTSFTYHPYGTSTLGAGQVSLINGPLSNDTLKHTYDQLGRLKKLEIVDDATQTVVSYSDDYTFDTRARVTNVANNLGGQTYTFVGQSNRPSTVTYANGMQVLYDYYTATGDFMLKQIKNLTSGGTPTVISQFDYTYKQDRSIDTWKVDQGSGATTWTFGYDAARELTAATLRNAGMTVLEANSYGYDKAGNRIQVGNGTAPPKNYDVNTLNQLLSARDHGRTTFAGTVDEPAKVTVNGQPAKMTSNDGGAPYRFEAVVNLDAGANTVVVQAKDGRNNTSTKNYSVATTGTTKTFEYDGNGNLRYEKQPNGTVIREYRWDQQNRLVRELQGAHESVYDYDGESRRVRIRELESSVQTKDETFIWCGDRICQKRSGATVVRSYFKEGFEQGTADYFYTRDRSRERAGGRGEQRHDHWVATDLRPVGQGHGDGDGAERLWVYGALHRQADGAQSDVVARLRHRVGSMAQPRPDWATGRAEPLRVRGQFAHDVRRLGRSWNQYVHGVRDANGKGHALERLEDAQSDHHVPSLSQGARPNAGVPKVCTVSKVKPQPCGVLSKSLCLR